MTIQNKVSRRNFIKVSGITGAALTLGLYTQTQGAELQLLKTETAENLGVELNAWISIDTAGKVTIMNHRAEMGQGAFQTVPQMIAEELEVSPASADVSLHSGIDILIRGIGIFLQQGRCSHNLT